AFKLAWMVKYKKFLARHGVETFRRLMRDLDVPEVEYFRGQGEAPVYATYPFVIVACEGAFHGRTLGALQATRSKAAHQYAYPKSGNFRHLPYNSGDSLAPRIDPRPIGEILAAPGGARAVLEAGRVPADLFAGFVAEPLQGEGGYVPGDAAFFQACERTCRRHDAMFIVDEVQTFGRSGTLFLAEQLGVAPDALCVAKCAVVGATLARAEYERYLHTGWHSNTFGGGKIFDLSFGHAVVDTVARGRDPAFGGLTYLENCRVKGEYLAEKLDEIAARHPRTVLGHEGRGMLHGVTVRRREAVIAEGWKRGLKMLGCGMPGDPARIRLVFLADSLAREIDEFARVFEETIAAVEH
ncbi:MAG: aminotransferase class III-fold pyridoxal phosphate-dependent enzyme, partial [Planctomycetota bacterium]